MIKALIKRFKAFFGADWLDKQPVAHFSFEHTFFKPDKDIPTSLHLGRRRLRGFDMIRAIAIVPDALGPVYTDKQMFVIHIHTPRAATRKGRQELGVWFVSNGLDYQYIRDGIVQFHLPY